MPYITVNGTQIYYESEGSGSETIVFAHGLLMNSRMFDSQVVAFRDKYRCLRFDFRGQGKSEISLNGYDMDSLTSDTAQLIQKLNGNPCHFVGLSMGGFVGMRLALRFPRLVKSLILLNTSADPESRGNLAKYNLLNFSARFISIKSVVGQVMPMLFGRAFLSNPERNSIKTLWRANISMNHRLGIFRAVKGVLHRKGITEEIGAIHIPTLIIAGEKDRATPPVKSGIILQRIKGSQLLIIPEAGHTTCLETPTVVNQAMTDFLHQLM